MKLKTNVVDIIRGIERLIHIGRIGAALEVFCKATDHFPDDPELFRSMVNQLIHAGYYADALELFEQRPSVKSDLNLMPLLGRCLLEVGRTDEAQSLCNEVTSSGIETAEIVHLKGLLKYGHGEIEKAKSEFKKSIEMESAFGQAHADLGLMYIEEGRVEEGIDLIKSGFAITPENKAIADNFHQIVCDAKCFEIAESAFIEGIRKFPFHKQLHYHLIDLLIQQDKQASAMQWIEKAIYQFGISDGILSPAIAIRNKIGPMRFSWDNDQDATVSLCMIVKNEAHCLARCLFHTKPMVDEMIIVDTGSTDQTVDIAKCFGAIVHHHNWNDDFSEARNVSLSHATGKWVLVLDADELISPSDRSRLSDTIRRPDPAFAAYRFETRNYIDDVGIEGWQQNDGRYEEEEVALGWYPSRKVRLFPNDNRIRFANRVHELVEPSLREIGCPIYDCDVPVHHYGKLAQQTDIQKKRAYFQLGLKKSQEQSGEGYALVELAIQAGEIGAYGKAIELWNQVLQEVPNLPQAHFNLSYAFIQLGRYREGLEAAINAIKLDPTLKEALLNKSLCQIRLGDSKTVVSDLERFLNTFPAHPMAMGLLAVSYLLTKRSDRGLEIFGQLADKGFDCQNYVLEHARKLSSTGRSGDAITLLMAIDDAPYGSAASHALLASLMDVQVSSTELSIAILDGPPNGGSVLWASLPRMSEWDRGKLRDIPIVKEWENADFVIFPFALDQLYQKGGFSEMVSFLKSLPGFEKNEDRYVFFFRDDIERKMGLRSVIFRPNHSLDAMDLNSITLPYFVEDIYQSAIVADMKYHVNFVGALATHVYRAYMLLPFFEKKQLATYSRLLSIFSRLLDVRKEKAKYSLALEEANTAIDQLFPLEKMIGGVGYYFDIIADQFSRLPNRTQDHRKAELNRIMNASIATLCPRGVGTQSIRFFETMAMGRLPIVISDRYVFPLKEIIDYDRFTVRIKETRIGQLPEQMGDFFDRSSMDDIRKMGKLARQVWCDYFSPTKFEKYMRLTLSEVVKKRRRMNPI